MEKGQDRDSELFWSGYPSSSPERKLSSMLFVSISPRANCYHHNDSNDDEQDDKTTAHPLASGLLILLGLHQLIHSRLDMVSGLAHLQRKASQA